MFFNGILSHTVLKTAAKDDFRIQEEHGGAVKQVPSPESEMIDSANKVMNSLNETPLYARVDLVRTAQNTFALMELELIEPSLYFKYHSESAEAFANYIHDYWCNKNQFSSSSIEQSKRTDAK